MKKYVVRDETGAPIEGECECCGVWTPGIFETEEEAYEVANDIMKTDPECKLHVTPWEEPS